MLRIAGAGAEREGDIRVDEHIPLVIEWPRRPVTALWWMIDAPETLLQTGFDAVSGELVDVTLTLPGPIDVVDHGPPLAAPHVARGVPRADPAEWDRRAPRGSVAEFEDHYVRDAEPLHTELGPDHLLVRIGGGDGAAASELVCGRLRAGLSAEQALLWLCVASFSPEERTLLEAHAARSHAPLTIQPSTPAPGGRGLSRYIDQLLKSGHELGRQVDESQAEAASLGITGVPYFVIDGKYAFSGAQSLETFVSVLDRVCETEAAAD